jgi:2',3'-cyclic-nucleotide 2'-phosphodiesterase (5'-nucleotidase family)
MKPWGRRTVVLAGLLGLLALSQCPAAVGSADSIRTEVELSTKDADSKESALANVVADAIRGSAKSDAAFIAASSFNEVTLPKGTVGAADILKALEYKDDSIVLVKLTGDQITRALEHGLYLYPRSNSGFLQVSGLVVTINPNGEKERRVVSVKIDGDPLETGKTYHVAMPAPLANGALAYFKIWNKTAIEKDTNKTLETAIRAYLSDRKTITKGDDRLVIKK